MPEVRSRSRIPEDTGSERPVPLHPAVLDSGFPQFAETVKTGPPFANLAPDTLGNVIVAGTMTDLLTVGETVLDHDGGSDVWAAKLQP